MLIKAALQKKNRNSIQVNSVLFAYGPFVRDKERLGTADFLHFRGRKVVSLLWSQHHRRQSHGRKSIHIWTKIKNSIVESSMPYLDVH